MVCLTYSFPYFCAAASLFCAWMVRAHVSLTLQACPDVTLEDAAVLGESCPSSRDSSMNRVVLVLSLVLYLCPR